jgi:sulfate/thiosulfate transport system permease protein
MNTSQTPNAKRVREPAIVRWVLISIALLFLTAFLVLPLASVLVEAFAKGWQTYLDSIRDPDALSAIRLTSLASGIAVSLNLLFGLSAAWAVSRFSFKGKNLLISLIDLPLAVSPVVSGLIFVLLFGLHGWFGKWLDSHNISILFAVPGIVLATLFVTFPFVARELIPFMQAQGPVHGEYSFSSRCQTFAGVCCTESFSAALAPWGSLERSRWYPDIFAV